MRLLLIIFILTLNLFSTIGQVEQYYDRGSELGYQDNSYKIRLLHSDTISDCSCEGVFNMIKKNDTIDLKSCLKTKQRLDCLLPFIVNSYSTKGSLFGQWKKDVYEINPYQFAVAINRLDIVKMFQKEGEDLQQDLYCCISFLNIENNHGGSRFSLMS